MYSPTTRLLTVLSLLQSNRELTGSEIARRLEVDNRTVRRYITMLQDMGIPVKAERGRYGAYRLGRSAKMPPLIFSDAEAVAITLGLLAIREFRFPVDVAAVEGAIAKTERSLPEKLLQQARGLREAVTFNVSPYEAPPALEHHNFVVVLSTAVRERHRVHLHYRAFSGSETERDFDPYGIVYNEGFWYTAGFCHLRQEIRTFRLDRMAQVTPLSDTFASPEPFDVLATVLKSIALTSAAIQTEVWLGTSLDKAQKIFPTHLGTLEPVDDGVLFRTGSVQLQWIALLLLSVDFPVEVKSSETLKTLLRDMAVRAQRMINLPPNAPPHRLGD